MKKSLLMLSLFGVMLSSCDKKDDDAEIPVPQYVVEENEIPNGTSKMTYSVQVLSTSTTAKTTGLAGAKVTVSQAGGKSTQETDASGIVVFSDMKQGYVSIFIQGPTGFASINTEDNIDCYDCEYDNNDSEQLEFDQATFNLPKLGGILKGKIYYDGDNNGATANTAIPSGTVVTATYSTFVQPNVYTTTVGTDGAFTFTNLPESNNLSLSIDYQQPIVGSIPAQDDDFNIPAGSYNLKVGQTTLTGILIAN